jgi:tetratricopeptide (TPR) repeat protein
MSRLKRLVVEVHRRSLWQVLLIYVGAAWVAFEVMWTFTEALGLPTWFPRVGLALLVVLLPVVLATALVQEGVGERFPRRTILVVAVIYVASALVGFYVVMGLTRQFGLPDWLPGFVAVLLIVLLPIVLWTAFVKEEALGEAGEIEPSPRQAEASGIRGVLTWRNAFMGAVALFALLGVGVTGYMGVRLMGIGPLGTLFAKSALEEHDRIILADFENLTPDSTLGLVVTEAFRTDLVHSLVVRVAEREYVGAALRRMERDPDQPLDYETAREVAIREGLKAVVAGQVGSLGQGYVLSVRLVAAETGEELVAHRETADDEDALIPAIDRLSKWLRERIGESLTTVRSSPPLTQVRTASLEALRLYTEAVEELDETNLARAFYLVDRALEIDTLFTAAYLLRAAVRWSMGTDERAQMIEDSRRGYELRQRLSPVERLRAEAFYHWDITGDIEKVINAYLSLLELNPADVRALTALAVRYRVGREFARAEQVSRRAIEADSLSSMGWLNVVIAQFNQGKFDEAEETLRQFEMKLPEDRWIPGLRSSIASSLGDYSASEAHNPNNRLNRILLAQVQGRLGEAERQARNIMEGREQAGRSRAVLSWAVWLGYSYLVFGGAPGRAVEEVDSALQSNPLSDMEPDSTRWPGGLRDLRNFWPNTKRRSNHHSAVTRNPSAIRRVVK